MSYGIEVTQVDAVNCRIYSDEQCILEEIHSRYSYKMPNFQFAKKKMVQDDPWKKQWDGMIRLFSAQSRTLPVGLLNDLVTYCKQCGYDYDIANLKIPKKLDESTIDEYLANLNLPDNIEQRDYQIDSVKQMFKRTRMLLLSATSSGKSFMIYACMRIFLDLIKPDGKFLLIVPSTHLVEQMYGDFEEYANGSWSVSDHCTKVYSGQTLNPNANVWISTWQSIKANPQKFNLKQFQFVVFDEVHNAQSKCTRKIMESLTNAYYRLGTTGTLSESKTHEMVLRGLFGSVYKAISAKELMDQGYGAKLHIRCVQLIYPKDECKLVNRLDYQGEVDFILSHQDRMRFLTKLAKKLPGNSLFLSRYKEKYGKPLFDLFQKYTGKQVFYVNGDTSANAIEDIREIFKTKSDCIIVATYSKLKEGFSVKRLNNIVFATPYKAQIGVMQSIGRGMRKAHDKESFVLYDIFDDFTYVSRNGQGLEYYNQTLKHFHHRINIYEEQSFDFTLDSYSLKSGLNNSGSGE